LPEAHREIESGKLFTPTQGVEALRKERSVLPMMAQLQEVLKNHGHDRRGDHRELQCHHNCGLFAENSSADNDHGEKEYQQQLCDQHTINTAAARNNKATERGDR
jgi:hypothetical protein